MAFKGMKLVISPRKGMRTEKRRGPRTKAWNTLLFTDGGQGEEPTRGWRKNGQYSRIKTRDCERSWKQRGKRERINNSVKPW